MKRAARLPDDQRRELQDVYRRNISAVYAFFRYSVDAHTAEDLTAATFERVMRTWARYDASRASVELWILTIARNILRDHYRRQRFRSGPSLDEHPALADHLVVAEEPGQSALAFDAIRDWLRHLQPREREVLGLRYGADLSPDEIARCLGLSRANVHQISSRALRRLRDVADRPDADQADFIYSA